MWVTCNIVFRVLDTARSWKKWRLDLNHHTRGRKFSYRRHTGDCVREIQKPNKLRLVHFDLSDHQINAFTKPFKTQTTRKNWQWQGEAKNTTFGLLGTPKVWKRVLNLGVIFTAKQNMNVQTYHFPPRTHSTVSDWYDAVNWNFDAFFPTRWSRFQTEVIFHLLENWRPLSPTRIAFPFCPPLLVTHRSLAGWSFAAAYFSISHRNFIVYLIVYTSSKTSFVLTKSSSEITR